MRTWISLRFPSGLTAVMPEGIRALEAYPAGRKVRELKWLRVTGRYEYDRADPAEMARKLSAFYAQDAIVITRKTKRGEGQMDIVPAIAELHIRPEETCVTVEAVVSAQEPTLNPDHLVAALQQLAPELAPDFAAFTRHEVLYGRYANFPLKTLAISEKMCYHFMACAKQCFAKINDGPLPRPALSTGMNV